MCGGWLWWQYWQYWHSMPPSPSLSQHHTPGQQDTVEHTGQEMVKCAAHIFYILFLLRLGPGVSFSLLQCIKHQYSSTISTPLHSGKFREVISRKLACSIRSVQCQVACSQQQMGHNFTQYNTGHPYNWGHQPF